MTLVYLVMKVFFLGGGGKLFLTTISTNTNNGISIQQ